MKNLALLQFAAAMSAFPGLYQGERQSKGIPESIRFRGKGPRMRRSRSRYSPVEEDRKHGITSQ